PRPQSRSATARCLHVLRPERAHPIFPRHAVKLQDLPPIPPRVLNPRIDGCHPLREKGLELHRGAFRVNDPAEPKDVSRRFVVLIHAYTSSGRRASTGFCTFLVGGYVEPMPVVI